MKIAITGHRGRLGSELVKNFGCVPLPCDIVSKREVQDALSDIHPDVVINCAAITDVDGCEPKSSPVYGNAIIVNTDGVYNLLNYFDERFVHISSDYIFTGKRGPYSENDEDSPPVNGYGWTKWGGEAMIDTYRSVQRKNITIVRTTGLFGGCSGNHDFVHLVINTLSQGKPLNVISTLIGNQTYVPFLAEGLMHVINLNVPIIHIASTDLMSRYEFALAIADEFGLDKKLIHPVKKIDSWIAPRPTKGGLRVRLAKSLGIPLYSILDGLKAFHNAKI